MDTTFSSRRAPVIGRRGALAAAVATAGLLAVRPRPAAADPVPTFSDVPAGSLFADEIRWLVDRGIVSGWPDNTFRPQAPVARDAMAAFLYRISPSLARPATGSRFVDVGLSTQFVTEIEWMAERAISTGWSDGTYRPLVPVSRAAMAAFLCRTSLGPGGRLTSDPPRMFQDVPGTHQFAREINWLGSRGISTGWPDGTFRPELPIERAAMAAFLRRSCETLPGFTVPGTLGSEESLRQVEGLIGAGLQRARDEVPMAPLNEDRSVHDLARRWSAEMASRGVASPDSDVTARIPRPWSLHAQMVLSLDAGVRESAKTVAGRILAELLSPSNRLAVLHPSAAAYGFGVAHAGTPTARTYYATLYLLRY